MRSETNEIRRGTMAVSLPPHRPFRKTLLVGEIGEMGRRVYRQAPVRR